MFQIFSGHRTKELLKNNKEAIRSYNAGILPGISITGGLVSLVSFICSFFREDMRLARISYLAILVLCGTLLLLSKKRVIKKYSLFFLYVEVALFYICTMYLSLSAVKERPAASLLLALAVYPTVFVDSPFRMTVISISMYLLHTVFAFFIKGPVLGKIDAINGLVALVMGIFVGFVSIHTKLKALDFERLLTMEKETDVLTSLYSRRKLYEVLIDVQNKKAKCPSAVLMCDFDHFKEYNDKYGHVEGDRCLKTLGSQVRLRDWNSDVHFYRYGGEEFIGLVYDESREGVRTLSEKIRSFVESIPIHHGPVTVSLGYVYIGENEELNCETWVNKADKALYEAKKRGRNCIVEYTETLKE